MTRYTLPFALAITLLIASVAGAASIPGLLSGGAVIHDGELDPYVYGEIGLTETLAVGVEYSPKAIAVSGWMGQTSGYYGELAWLSGSAGMPNTIEIGLWGSTDQVSSVTLTGWLGARTQLGKSDLSLTANGEATIPVTDAVHGIVGATTTLLGETTALKAWLGLGFYF